MKVIKDFRTLAELEETITGYKNLYSVSCLSTKSHAVLFYDVRGDEECYPIASDFEAYCFLQQEDTQQFLLSVGFTEQEIAEYIEKVENLNKTKLQSMDETGKKLKELQGEFESLKDTWENPDFAESSYV